MAAKSPSLIEMQQLRQDNELLQQKYKKALQELMHVLQVNKALKESHPNVDSQSIPGKHHQQTQLLKAQLEQERLNRKQDEHRASELRRAIQALSEQKQRLREQLSALEMKSIKTENQLVEMREREQNHHACKFALEKQLETLKRENLQLAIDHQVRDKDDLEADRLRQQLTRLQKHVRQIQTAFQERESEIEAMRMRVKAEVAEVENYYQNLRRQQGERLRNTEYKCMLLESELHNSKSIEQLLQDESRHMQDEDILFQNFRQQLQKINEDWNRLDLQKQEELETLRNQNATKAQKIAELQTETKKNIHEIQDLKGTIKKIHQQLKDQARLEQKVAFLEAEKKEIAQRNHVLEAITVAQSHRPGSEASERIHEVQRRIQLLLEQKAKDGRGFSGVQQVVILKSYIRQLSELLNGYKRRQQKLKKSKSVLKMRQLSIEKDYQGKLDVCKKKLTDYDNLVAKFCHMLEHKLKENPNSSDQEIRTVINQYEEKMITMSEEIIRLKNQLAEAEAASQEKEDSANNVSHALQEDERQIHHLKELINQQQFHISGLEAQNRNLITESSEIHRAAQEAEGQAREVFREKDQIISGLTEENNKLQREIRQIKKEKQKLKEVIETYEKEVANLRSQIELNRPKGLPNGFKGSHQPELASRIHQLSQAVSKLQKEKEELSAHSTELLKQNVKQYELKFQAQSQEIEECRAQLNLLASQLEKERNNKEGATQDISSEQYRREIEALRARQKQLELTISQMEKQLQAVEEHYKAEVQALEERNHEITVQLTHKQAELQQCQDALGHLQAKQEENLIRSTKEIMTQFEDLSTQALKKNSKEIERLNADILSLKTAKLALENEIKDRDYIISELKHEIFSASLKLQKQKSTENLYPTDNQIERLNGVVASAQAEIEALRLQNQQLQQLYSSQVADHKASLHRIEERQEQLNNAIQNNTSLEGVVNFLKKSHAPNGQGGLPQEINHKIDLRPKENAFSPEKFKVVESYDTIPVNEAPRLKPAAKSAEPLAGEARSANFDRKKELENGVGSKRSIKMIKMAARPSIEIDSPLLPPDKRE